MAAKLQLSKEPLDISHLNPDEEDALIHARITNDERPLRRLTKKFHTYASVAYPPIVEPASTAATSVEEAREAFMIELAGFQLLLRKSRMVCDAERRQVNVYKQENQHVANERTVLRNKIEELKIDLEQAQLERRRKIEYDQVTEKINVLPSREELELSISALENDIQVIKDEHGAQNRSILARKAALDGIVADIGKLKILGLEVPKTDAGSPRAASELPETEMEPTASASGMDVDIAEGTAVTEGGDEKSGEAHTQEGSILNPAAKPFSSRLSTPSLSSATLRPRVPNSMSGLSLSGLTPSVSRDATPVFTPVGGPDSSPLSPVDPPSPVEEGDKREEGEEDEEGEEGEETEDIEMGEVSEGPKGKKNTEDREEGEASDESSVLSDPPDE